MPNLLSGKAKASGQSNYISLKDAQISLGKPVVDKSVLIGRLDGSTSWLSQALLTGSPKNVLYVNKNGSDSNAGTSSTSAKLTIRAALALATPGTSIVVSSGTYQERNPLKVPIDVTVIGQDSSSVTVIPELRTEDVFRLTSGSAIYGISVSSHKAPSYAFSIEPGSKVLVSPLIKNCSIITGPFLNDGTLFQSNLTIQNSTIAPGLLPLINESEVPDATKRVNPNAAGGGILVDGESFSDGSLVKNVIADQVKIENQGGIGVFVKNKASLQGTGVTTQFSSTSFKASLGGAIVLNGCTSAYGLYGLTADGYYAVPDITGAYVTETEYSTVKGVSVSDHGSGYLSAPLVQIAPPTDPNGIQATAIAEVVNGQVVNIYMVNEGSGYTTIPSVTIIGDNTTPAVAGATLSKSSQIGLSNITEKPLVSSVVLFEGDPEVHFVTDATAIFENTTQLSINPNVYYVLADTAANFYTGSRIVANGHAFTYVGAGVTYNALPTNGGKPITTNEVVEVDAGRVYYSSVSETGVYKIGNLFQVDQITGNSTVTSSMVNLTDVSSIGPLLRFGVPVGVAMKEISADGQLISSTGLSDPFTVPTQTAIITYLENNYLALKGGTMTGEIVPAIHETLNFGSDLAHWDTGYFRELTGTLLTGSQPNVTLLNRHVDIFDSTYLDNAQLHIGYNETNKIEIGTFSSASSLSSVKFTTYTTGIGTGLGKIEFYPREQLSLTVDNGLVSVANDLSVGNELLIGTPILGVGTPAKNVIKISDFGIKFTNNIDISSNIVTMVVTSDGVLNTTVVYLNVAAGSLNITLNDYISLSGCVNLAFNGSWKVVAADPLLSQINIQIIPAATAGVYNEFPTGMLLSKQGFFGYQRSSDTFTFIPSATIDANKIVVGNVGTIKANIVSPLVEISSGTIDNTAIGLTIPAESAFTSVETNKFVMPLSSEINIENGTSTVIDMFNAVDAKMKKYIIKVEDTVTSSISGLDLLMIHDNSSIYTSEYGIVHSNGPLGTFIGRLQGGVATLEFTPSSINNTRVSVFVFSA